MLLEVLPKLEEFLLAHHRKQIRRRMDLQHIAPGLALAFGVSHARLLPVWEMHLNLAAPLQRRGFCLRIRLATLERLELVARMHLSSCGNDSPWLAVEIDALSSLLEAAQIARSAGVTAQGRASLFTSDGTRRHQV